MALQNELGKPYFSNLLEFLAKEPSALPHNGIFRALDLTPAESVRVVILGQDPYPTPGAANGLAFSVNPGHPVPPSLKNIFKEIRACYPGTVHNSGDLTTWSCQGVLMLNSVLTVRPGAPGSHRGKGWEQFTDKIIEIVNAKETPVIFLLWGNAAKAKAKLVDQSKHIVLTAAHPSPNSAYNGKREGFFGCRHFLKVNQTLIQLGQPPIDWST